MQNYAAPVAKLNANRNPWLDILLGFITCGLYYLIPYTTITDDVNTVCSRYDGRKSMHYLLMYFIVGPLTFGIGSLVWCHNLADRIGNELRRRGIYYSFGASDFWLWGILGSFIFVGPFVYYYKLVTAMNLLNGHYNING